MIAQAPKIAGFTFFACIVAAALATACSDDAPPAAGTAGSSGSSGLPAEGGTGPGATSDAAGITPRPDLCQAATSGGDRVSELELPGEPPPPLGGTIAPGTYDLVELNAYADPKAPADAGEEGPQSRPTGQAAQITIVVTQNELRFLEARGPADSEAGWAPATARAMLYRTDGTSLVMTAVCPATAAPAGLPFSAVGNGFALFVDPSHRQLFVAR